MNQGSQVDWDGTVLQSIIEGVLEDVKERAIPLSQLQSALTEAPVLRGALRSLSEPEMSVIAEVKRSSPSKGALAEILDPATLAQKYEAGGASVVSVLTEQRRFKGSIADFVSVRREITLPVLRKDFIVTEFQILESRILGADLLLLIVAGLSQKQLVDFYQMSSELGMDILVEIHNYQELESALDIGAKIIGVNSRNLKTLEVDPIVFEQLIPLMPQSVIKVAESGISTRGEVAALAELGADAILVGETLVRSADPAAAIFTLLGRSLA